MRLQSTAGGAAADGQVHRRCIATAEDAVWLPKRELGQGEVRAYGQADG